MILFYTGAVKTGAQQPIASQSLGGYISSTIVPNGLLGNIFTSLSESEIDGSIIQIRCIVLQNIFSTDQTNVRIWVETETDSLFDVQLGVVETFFVDSCSSPYLESIQADEQSPYYVDFHNSNGALNAYVKDVLSAGSYLGIWMKRVIIPPAEVIIPDNGFPLTSCEQEFITLGNKTDLTVGDFKLIVDWGSISVNPQIQWGYSLTDPDGNEDNLIFQFNKLVNVGDTSVALDFTLDARENYAFVKIPINTIPNLITWTLDPYNYGTLPDQVWKDRKIVGDFEYYFTRAPFLMNANTIVTLTSINAV